MTKLVADVGGTNARFALVDEQNSPTKIEVLATADFPSLQDAALAYLKQVDAARVEQACLAVAAPVNDHLIDLPNNEWHFTRDELRTALGCEVQLINDFTAQVYALSHKNIDMSCWFGQARPTGKGIHAVIGAGTGLGMAARVANGGLVDSEWGHISFAPTDTHQMLILQHLWSKYSRVSVERLLSGMGLENIYWANAMILGESKQLPACDITAAANQGDMLALKAVEDFLDIYADTAGDVALALGATQGVFLAGGMLAHVQHHIDPIRFRTRFEAKGRFNQYCADIPLAIVGSEQPGLMGCCQFLVE